MTTIRIILGLIGIWLTWFGVSLVLEQSPTDLTSIALWFAGAIVLHDGVFAPLCAAAGFAGKRILPPSWSGPVTIGAVCTVTLALIAVPVFGREFAVAGNPTVLDRDYHVGFVVAVAVVWSLVLAAALIRAMTRRRSS